MRRRIQALSPRFAYVDFGSLILLLAGVILVAVFAFVLRDTAFLSGSNLLNIVRQTTPITVMAVGVVFVLSAREIDLSFASVVPLAALASALTLAAYGPIAAVAVAIGIGAAIGAINGLIVVGLGIPSFIVTLGMLSVASGASRWITNLDSVPVRHEGFVWIFGSGWMGTIPVLLIWSLGAVALGEYFLKRTRYGHHVLAAGGNRDAARYAGIKTARVRVSVLILSGTLAGVAALLYMGRIHSARYTLGGEADLLSALAAAIIGGTALSGGKGTVIGAGIGSILMGLINNALILMGLSTAQQTIFRGILIIAAVALGSRQMLSKE